VTILPTLPIRKACVGVSSVRRLAARLLGVCSSIILPATAADGCTSTTFTLASRLKLTLTLTLAFTAAIALALTPIALPSS